jgi:hypothetical protein
MPKHYKKEKSNFKVTRDDFEKYLNECVDFISALVTLNGTHFLDIYGGDGGNLTETKIKDANIKYSDVDVVDEWINDLYEVITKYHRVKLSRPSKTFKSFIEELNNGQSKV